MCGHGSRRALLAETASAVGFLLERGGFPMSSNRDIGKLLNSLLSAT
jgi:hypothetical protein